MPSCTTEKVEVKRAEILARDDTDPVLSFAYCAADYGVSLATFKRSILPDLPVVEISDRRKGVRRSDHEARKARRTRKPKAA
jgi:hypothetical protein